MVENVRNFVNIPKLDFCNLIVFQENLSLFQESMLRIEDWRNTPYDCFSWLVSDQSYELKIRKVLYDFEKVVFLGL